MMNSKIKIKSEIKIKARQKQKQKQKQKQEQRHRTRVSDLHGPGPLVYGMGFAAIHALGYGELGGALRTDGAGLESVKCLPTLAALPELADGRGGFADWTGKADV